MVAIKDSFVMAPDVNRARPIPDEELRRRTDVALRTHGVSLCEFFVLCSAGYRVNEIPKRFVDHAIWASRGDPRGRFSNDEFQAAYERCLGRGLLKILAPEDFDASGTRTQPSPHAADDSEVSGAYRPGHVDFTEPGYVVHAAIVQLIHGSVVST